MHPHIQIRFGVESHRSPALLGNTLYLGQDDIQSGEAVGNVLIKKWKGFAVLCPIILLQSMILSFRLTPHWTPDVDPARRNPHKLPQEMLPFGTLDMFQRVHTDRGVERSGLKR